MSDSRRINDDSSNPNSIDYIIKKEAEKKQRFPDVPPERQFKNFEKSGQKKQLQSKQKSAEEEGLFWQARAEGKNKKSTQTKQSQEAKDVPDVPDNLEAELDEKPQADLEQRSRASGFSKKESLEKNPKESLQQKVGEGEAEAKSAENLPQEESQAKNLKEKSNIRADHKPQENSLDQKTNQPDPNRDVKQAASDFKPEGESKTQNEMSKNSADFQPKNRADLNENEQKSDKSEVRAEVSLSHLKAEDQDSRAVKQRSFADDNSKADSDSETSKLNSSQTDQSEGEKISQKGVENQASVNPELINQANSLKNTQSQAKAGVNIEQSAQSFRSTEVNSRFTKSAPKELPTEDRSKTQDKRFKTTRSDSETAAQASYTPQKRASTPVNIEADEVEVSQKSTEEFISELVEEILVIKSMGKEDTLITLQNPKLLKGATIRITTYKDAPGQINLVFAGLSPKAKKLIDSKSSHSSLTTRLKNRAGITLHNIITSTDAETPEMIIAENKRK